MTLGVAVIGAGEMGRKHAAHWREAGSRVVAVHDAALERARALANAVGCEASASAQEALSRVDVDVVSVCTPTYLHAGHTVSALNAGKHVLCEKPAALTLADAQAMRRAAQRSGRQLRIGFMRRFDPAFHQLRALLSRVGTPVLSQVTIAAGVRPKHLMHDALANGGPIIDMCCHVFHLWETLFEAQAETVSARGYTFSENKPELASIEQKALDSALITLAYPGGSLGQVQVSWGLPAGIRPTERHTYMGPDGLITVVWNRQITMRSQAGVTRWTSSGVDAWLEEIRYFQRELTQGAPRRLATIDDGIEALNVSLAVLESVRSRREVRVRGPLAAIPESGSRAT